MQTPPKYSREEIERRWLVMPADVPDLSGARVRQIEDHYINDTRLRLRCVREPGVEPTCKLGKKYEAGSGGAEPVVTIYLTAEEYEVFRKLPGITATKMRYSIAGGSLDVYTTPVLKFHIYEVEFTNREQARAYEPPVFVDEEITGVAEFSGFALACKTR